MPVDSQAAPLLERIECNLQIDHDYISRVTLRSSGRGAEESQEFHDLEFGLSLFQASGDGNLDDVEEGSSGPEDAAGSLRSLANSNLYQRTNVAIEDEDCSDDELWRLVPGDLVESWQPSYFDTRCKKATLKQMEERNFYVPCARCGRRSSQILAEGCEPCGLQRS